MTSARPKVVVVGAGIVGASIAYHLARRGAPVTLVDKGQPAGAVTGKAFGWINVSHSVPEPYLRLRLLAVQEYRRLEQELDQALRVSWCGALTWSSDQAETERLVRDHAACGYDIRLVDREEIAILEPNLIEPPDCAALAASEGTLEPAEATTALVHAAQRAGAEVLLDSDVVAFGTRGDRVTSVRVNGNDLDADVVVSAAGTGSAALCAEIGVDLPVDPSPALLLRFRSATRLVRSVISGPEIEARQGAGGRLFATENFSEGSDIAAIAERSLDLIKQNLRGAETVQLVGAEVGQRPMPADGFPIVGFGPQIEGLYLAALHAGVTMAPLIGRFAATEVLDGITVEVLESCRLDRFLAESPRPGR